MIPGRGLAAVLAVLAAAVLAVQALQESVPPATAGCNPQESPCTVRGDGWTVTLRLPPVVRPLERFPVQVRLAGAAAAAGGVAVRFDMAGMDMGVNRFGLSRQADGSWQGQAMLPACASGSGDWRVTVEVAGAPAVAARYAMRAGG